MRTLRLIAGYYFYHFILRFLRHTHRPTQTKILPLICRILGAILILLNNKRNKIIINLYKTQSYILKNILRNAWYFNTILNTIAWIFLYKRNSYTYKITDQGILESIGPNNITKTRINFTNKIRFIQSSNLYTHMTLIILFYSIFTINKLHLRSSKSEQETEKLKDAG